MEELPDTRGAYGTRSGCSSGLHMEGTRSRAEAWFVSLPLRGSTQESRMENNYGVGIYMPYDRYIFVEHGRLPLVFFCEPKSMRICSWNVQGLGGSQHQLEKRWFRREWEADGCHDMARLEPMTLCYMGRGLDHFTFYCNM